MIFRLSQQLKSKIKAGNLPSLPLDENPFADCSAGLFLVSRRQYILVTNTKSLYSVVIPGKGITNENAFIEQALHSLQEFMEENAQGDVYERYITPATETTQFAKALNRSVTGSMNELIRQAEYWLAEEPFSLNEVSVRLNDTLLSALAHSKSFPYGKPRDVFQAMVNAAESTRPENDQ